MAEEPLEERRASARNLVAEDDETVKMSPEERKKEKRKITKNVLWRSIPLHCVPVSAEQFKHG